MTGVDTSGQSPILAAFYLPQFHPIPENDEFWGPGFTEWRNVVRSRPVFRGHVQPRIPADLGFYDLRCVDTQIAQAEMAAEHGIGAFCYYHYWFNGRPILDRPLRQVLAHPDIDLPFFICWANEDWTRRWDGRAGDVLLQQEYSEADDRKHIDELLPMLADPRYLKVDGFPVVAVYRARLLPDPRRTADLWRERAASAGLRGLHLCAVESMSGECGDPTSIGFDAAIDFQPDWQSLGPPSGRTRIRKLGLRLGRDSPWFRHRIYSYGDVIARMAARPEPSYLRYGCVTPRWDNSPRRSTDATIISGSTSEMYGRWLERTLAHAVRNDHPLLFINAWNEWAEGAYLEPDLDTGHSYLKATLRAVTGGGPST